ncbi:hypothetical protein MCOR25_007061 [Pyricularia grisea]|nr:hypothetical protein MCOR25_007061 [Pyricularia grisea]
MAAMQKVIQLGRIARERRSISLKAPLMSLAVISDAQFLADIDPLKSYVADELNVREVSLTEDEEKTALPCLTQQELRQHQKDKKITVGGIELDENDLTIVRVLAQDDSGQRSDESLRWEASFDLAVVVLLDAAPHPELLDGGLASDVVNRVQRLRKKAGLVPTDDVHIQYDIVENPDEVDMQRLVKSREAHFMSTLRARLEPTPTGVAVADGNVILEEERALGSLVLRFRLVAVK